jgi:hypothetical protein
MRCPSTSGGRTAGVRRFAVTDARDNQQPPGPEPVGAVAPAPAQVERQRYQAGQGHAPGLLDACRRLGSFRWLFPAQRVGEAAVLVFGMDFTSAPRAAKPITRVCCRFDGGVLLVEGFEDLRSFGAFEQALCRPGPWIAGIDFPFGQSRKLLTNMGWPLDWSVYVGVISGMTRQRFVETLERYKANRPAGDKEHRRATDREAGSISPQKLYGVPVGRMFFEGAQRLLRSPASVVPVRPLAVDRVVVEAYPALVARRWAGGQGYKTDTKARQSQAQRAARRRILDGLVSGELRAAYGYTLGLSDRDRARMLDDSTGDQLDALLCAVQAAWAWVRRDAGYGIPESADASEGWIVDPGMVGAQLGSSDGLNTK